MSVWLIFSELKYMSTFHLKVDQKDSIAVYFKEGDLNNILINNKNTRTSELGAGVSHLVI